MTQWPRALAAFSMHMVIHLQPATPVSGDPTPFYGPMGTVCL